MNRSALLFLIGAFASLSTHFCFAYIVVNCIDQPLKMLFETWHPEDIPCVFVGPSDSITILSPTFQQVRSALLPLNIFVHELLKCCILDSILQTAATRDCPS
jgi:hypothetical protein